MNIRTPSHLLRDSQPTSITSAEAVHKAPLGATDGTISQLPASGLQPVQTLPLPPQSQQSEQQQEQQQQQQQQQKQQPQSQQSRTQHSLNGQTKTSCSTHKHRNVGGSHKSLDSNGVSATVCSNCSTNTTPLWRRAPSGETICNACGLYYKARNAVRPPWLKRNAIKKIPAQSVHGSTSGSCPGDGQCNGTGGSTSCEGCPAFNQHHVNRQALVCANCRTTTTPLWRRDEAGNTICNACGLYYKLHNIHRPVTMKRSVIKRRKRVPLPLSPQPHHIAPSPTIEDGDLSDHTPGLSVESGGETGSSAEEDEGVPVLGKRKSSDEPARNSKRADIGFRPVAPIEDIFLQNNNNNDTAEMNLHYLRHQQHQIQHHHQHQHHHQQDGEERRRSLTPVEPSIIHSTSQVQIHHQRYPNGVVTSEPSAHVTTTTSSSPYTSPGISALLNPVTPTPLPSISLAPANPPTLTTAIVSPSAIVSGPQATHYPQNMQVDILVAHRQELQREVSNLSVLLNRTAAMLSNLDNHMAASNQSNPLANIIALSNVAASSAYVTPAQSPLNLPPLPMPLAQHGGYQRSPPMSPDSSRPGSPSTILPLPSVGQYARD